MKCFARGESEGIAGCVGRRRSAEPRGDNRRELLTKDEEMEAALLVAVEDGHPARESTLPSSCSASKPTDLHILIRLEQDVRAELLGWILATSMHLERFIPSTRHDWPDCSSFTPFETSWSCGTAARDASSCCCSVEACRVAGADVAVREL